MAEASGGGIINPPQTVGDGPDWGAQAAAVKTAARLQSVLR
jgi:hypothetical protein